MKDQDLTNNLDKDQISDAEVGEEDYAPPKDEEAMIEEGKAAAILGYVPFLCFIPLIKMRDNPFAFRHGNRVCSCSS